MNVTLEVRIERDYTTESVESPVIECALAYRCLVCKTMLHAPGHLLEHPVLPGCAYSGRRFSPPVLNLIEVK